MGRIIAIGMSNTDFVCRTPKLPVAGETVAGTSFETFAGGKGANQAVAASRCGAHVWFGGAVGGDEHGHARRRELVEAGVDVEFVQELPGVASGIALIVVDVSGNNQIVTVAGANDAVNADVLTHRMAAIEYDLVLLTWELHVSANRRILEGVKPGVPIVLTTAPYDPSVNDIFPNDRVIVVSNRIEASQMLGREISDDNAASAAGEIQRLGCRAAVITLGAQGAAWSDATASGHVPAAVVEVLDTTGAGDAFSGAFAAWLVDGATIREAVEAGVQAGSVAVTRAGAQPSLPTRDEVVAAMRATTG